MLKIMAIPTEVSIGKKENDDSSTNMAIKINAIRITESIAILRAFRNVNFRPLFFSSKKLNYIFPMISNMGMYMAMITLPTSPPSKSIKIGSIKEINASTA